MPPLLNTLILLVIFSYSLISNSNMKAANDNAPILDREFRLKRQIHFSSQAPSEKSIKAYFNSSGTDVKGVKPASASSIAKAYLGFPETTNISHEKAIEKTQKLQKAESQIKHLKAKIQGLPNKLHRAKMANQYARVYHSMAEIRKLSHSYHKALINDEKVNRSVQRSGSPTLKELGNGVGRETTNLEAKIKKLNNDLSRNINTLNNRAKAFKLNHRVSFLDFRKSLSLPFYTTNSRKNFQRRKRTGGKVNLVPRSPLGPRSNF